MPPDPRAEKLLQRVLKCLELNRLKILELDCQLQPDAVRKIDELPDAVLIKHQGRVWEFDLNDEKVKSVFGPQAGGYPDQYDVLDMLQENIELYLQIPVEQQVFYVERDRQEMLIDDIESFREAFYGWRKALLIVKQASHGDSHDLDTTAVPSGPSKASRLLQVRFRGHTHNWLDLDEHRELLLDRPDLVLRDNICEHFHIPCEFQEISDSYGPLQSAADFRRVLQSRSPVLELVDIRHSPRLSPPEANVLWNGNNRIGSPSIRKVPAPVPVSPSPYFRTMPPQSPQAAIGPEAGSMFHALDQNHDGVISRKEWNQAFGSPSPYSYGSSPGSPGMQHQPTFGTHFDRFGAAADYQPMINQQPLGTAALGGRVEAVLRKETALDNTFGFGITFDQESRVLLITSIVPDGLLARWNMRYPGSSLQIGDAILSVNGTANDAVTMRGQLQVARDVQLTAQKG